MTYTSLEFYLFLMIALVLYYIIPLQFRWLILLTGSFAFYFEACKADWRILIITILLIYMTYGAGLFIRYLSEKYPDSRHRLKKGVLALAILLTVLPWFFIKNGDFIFKIMQESIFSCLAPLGISFYTLQMISYLTDIYKGKIKVQRNIAKYALFVLFFPQIIQGPIPRYGQLAEQLYKGHQFDENMFVKGLQLIIWGFFLKFMIADKSAVIVNTVFDSPAKYTGCYVWVAGILYSLELYTDFLACVSISQGVAGLFGIKLVDNFCHPYFSTSIKEFWRRWHISLSEWFRDYVYIPLGGSRKGRLSKYINLMITFLISGVWHGCGYKFLFWGFLHAVYQIAAELTVNIRTGIYEVLGLSEQSGIRKIIQRIGVFFWVMLAWIIFRADSLDIGLEMIRSLFLVWNPWIFFNDRLFTLGLDWKEWNILTLSMAILIFVGSKQESGMHIRTYVSTKPFYVRWVLYILAIAGIVVFGTYGFGFSAQDFIYGGF